MESAHTSNFDFQTRDCSVYDLYPRVYHVPCVLRLYGTITWTSHDKKRSKQLKVLHSRETLTFTTNY